MRQESDAGIGNVTRMKERALCHDCIRAALLVRKWVNSTVYTENANDIEKRFAKGIKLNLIREERDMKAKKLIGLMLATALSVTSLAGCGNTGAADTADKADSKKTEAGTTETTEAAGNEPV